MTHRLAAIRRYVEQLGRPPTVLETLTERDLLGMLRDLLAHVDDLEKRLLAHDDLAVARDVLRRSAVGPADEYRVALGIRQGEKVAEWTARGEAAERLARLVLATCDTMTYVNPREPDNWPDGVLPRPRKDAATITDEMRAEARRVLGDK